MNTNIKILSSVGAAVLIAWVSFGLGGIYYSLMGFVITLLVIGLFAIWNKYRREEE